MTILPQRNHNRNKDKERPVGSAPHAHRQVNSRQSLDAAASVYRAAAVNDAALRYARPPVTVGGSSSQPSFLPNTPKRARAAVAPPVDAMRTTDAATSSKPAAVNKSEHNSDDETHMSKRTIVVDAVEQQASGSTIDLTLDQLETNFRLRMKDKGLLIKEMKGDGNCLFRAIADQVYGDEEMHTSVRKLCMDYIVANRDHFSGFITEEFDDYVRRKQQEGEHGNHVEMQAVAEMFNRPVHVHEYSVEPLNTFQPDAGTDNPPLRVSYHAAVHYNSLVDPNAATIGIGLGLPGFKPGLADAQLVHDAVRVSEQQAIEEAMLADKLAATDWEATEHSLQQQVARQSYVEWLQLQSSARKTTGRRSPKRDVTLASEKHLSPPLVQHPHERTASAAVTSHGDGRTVRDKAAETADALTTGCAMDETSSSATSAREEDDLDRDVLAQILALSHQEYIDEQKRKNDEHSWQVDNDNKPSTSKS